MASARRDEPQRAAPVHGAKPATRPAPRRPALPAAPANLLRLQGMAGNAAVSGLLTAQRDTATCPASPIAPPGVTPATDPKFQSLKKDVTTNARTAKAHPPVRGEVKKAQDAAVAPPDDKEAQAKVAKAGKMDSAKPAGFDKAGFIAAVSAAIAKQAPGNLDEADKFATSGKADQIKSEVMGKVTQGKDASAKDVTDKTKEPPDPSRAVDKPVTPLPPQAPPPALTTPDPRRAVPDKAPAEQTDLRADQCATNAKMAEAGVTDDQLAKSNEPELTGALVAKQVGEAHTATAPAAVRANETQQLGAATANAAGVTNAGVAAMVGAHTNTGQHAAGAKSGAKDKDEQERARHTAKIRELVDRTEADVTKIIDGIDAGVTQRFETGERDAKSAFTADHQARMKRYKDERYAGVTGAARWTYDLFAGLPAEANTIFGEAKKVYEQKMQQVISTIADYVGDQLTAAKTRIATGRTEVDTYLNTQVPAAQRKLVGEASKELTDRFTKLESDVTDKEKSVVDDLAQKYVEARNAVDEEIKSLQAENKGLCDKAKEAVGGAIETIMKLKDMLLGVLARAAGAVELIIKDPIGFLGNLVNAVKTGVMNFGANIVEHLKAGLKAWLLGSLASAGIEIPDTFDVKGILKLILSILGLTWANVRTRILKFIPEPVLKALETTFEVVGILVSQGLPGLWKWVVEKLGDLKEMVLGQIRDFVIEKIVKAGITWLISLLNPAAAFIKACKAIYDIVMFFVEKAAQIKEFVDSVLDSIESIARGGAGAIAGLIEKALAKAVPMVLGMLASLLGLGGISEKIKSVLETVQKPVNKVIDSVVGTIVKKGKSLFKKLFGKREKEKDPAEIQKRLDKALNVGVAAVDRFAGRPVAGRMLKPILAVIRLRYRITKLEAVPEGGFWAVEGEINPKGRKRSQAKEPDPKEVREDIVRRLKRPEMRRGQHALGLKISPEIPHTRPVPKGGSHTTEFERETFRSGLGEFMTGGIRCHQCGTPIAESDRLVVDHIPPTEILNNIPPDILEDAGIYGEVARQTTNHQCDHHRAVQGGTTRVILAKYRKLKQLLDDQRK